MKNDFSGIESYIDALYFSIVTQTTVGYGDIMPKSKRAKVIVSIQILLSMYINIFELINHNSNIWDYIK